MSPFVKKLKIRLPAVILLVITLSFWGGYDRYKVAGPILLEKASLSDAFRVRGASSETNSVFTLARLADGPTADVRYLLPGASDYSTIRVEGRLRTKDVVRGAHSWNSARLIFIQRDEDSKWIPSPHGLLFEEGTTDWTFRRSEFEIQPESHSAEVVLQQSGKSGTAWFDSVRAYPVRIKASHLWLRLLFGAAWIAMGVIYFRRCRLNSRRLRVVILLNAAVIIVGSMMPGGWIEDSAQYVKAKLVKAFERKVEPAISAESPTTTAPEKKATAPTPVVKAEQESRLIDQFNAVVGGTHKAGHFALFASLCFLVYLSAALEHQHRSYFIKVAFDLFLFAAVTESLQHLTIDRSAGFSDWLIDVYGMLCAFVIFIVVLFLAKLMRISAFDLQASGS